MRHVKNIKFTWQRTPQRRLTKLFYSHKYHRWVYVRKRMTFQQLSEKYPDGVIPRWKANLMKVLSKGGYYTDPWFSDVLSKTMSFVLRG